MKKTKKLWILLTFPLLLGMASCKSGDGNNPVVPTDDIEAQLQRMTLREKVGQLFLTPPFTLTGQAALTSVLTTSLRLNCKL